MLYFYTTSEKSAKRFTCAAALNQDTYTSSVKGCAWHPNSQVNAPSSNILYSAVEYYPKEELAILYAAQDQDIRNKLLDGTYAAISSLALAYACEEVPALQKAMQKMSDSKLMQVALAYFGTTSLSVIFGGSIFTDIEKDVIMEKSNNFSNGLICYYYFNRSGMYLKTYEPWTSYPIAYAPAGYSGWWENGPIIELK